MHEDRVDKVLNYILSNTEQLSPEKISALSQVIKSLTGFNEFTHEPNTIPVVENHAELTEDQPIDFAEIQGIEVDGKKIETKIYKA